jgi:hypothetical protein
MGIDPITLAVGASFLSLGTQAISAFSRPTSPPAPPDLGAATAEGEAEARRKSEEARRRRTAGGRASTFGTSSAGLVTDPTVQRPRLLGQ